MILVSKDKGYQEIKTLIRAQGVICDESSIPFGDIAFEGNGPDGIIGVGIERKKLHDMLNCIEDSRFVSHQRLGMKSMYAVSFLFIEAMWKPREDGLLMESRDGCSWFLCRPNGRTVMYSKLRRYLISINLAGVHVNFTRNVQHTAIDAVEIFHYFQKPWAKHTSLREIQKLAIPQLNHKPSLVRKWAQALDESGIVMGESAERYFKRPITLATADETAWVQAGATPKKAIDFVKQIHGLT